MTIQLVCDETPGTAYLGCCLNCSRKIGQPHHAMCEFVTGEDDPDRHGGILGARLAQLRGQTGPRKKKKKSNSKRAA